MQLETRFCRSYWVGGHGKDERRRMKDEKDRLFRFQTSSLMPSVSNLAQKTDNQEPSTNHEHPRFAERGTSGISHRER